jgi:4-coumarate--CoA ligase (photoactive yellow protein activation family)
MTGTGVLSRPPSSGAQTGFVGAASVERLCIDLIAAEQERLLRAKRLSPRQRIGARLAACGPGEVGEIEIGEDALGIDSLMLLDLVGVVSNYFCLGDSGAEDLLLVHRTLGAWGRIVLAHFDRVGGGARIGFETSGSTGSPKRVVHLRATLEAEVDEILGSVLGGVAPDARILSCVPPRHIYGFLWSVLLSDRTGRTAVEFHRSAGEALFRYCRPGDLVIGTPFTWERAAGQGCRLPAGVTGVTSAGPSTAATWAAGRHLGLDHFVEIYGSTETGGLGWREAWDAPFQLSARFDRCGERLARRSSGEDVPLQDRLVWRPDGTFNVAGRRDSVVQVAGTNVSVEEVTRVLRGVEGVANAAVRFDGSRILALVVPTPGAGSLDALEDALRARVARDLAAPARPDRFSFAAEIPRTEIGKVAPW